MPSPHPTTPSPRPTTPKPVPSTSSPAPAPSSSSPSTSPTGSQSWAWCSSDAFGTFNTSDGFDLYNNEWNSNANPGPQKICGNNGHDWQVTSTQRANNTEVLTYPSVQKNYPNRALSSFTSMTSTYSENMNSTGGTDAEAAYDIWVNDLNKEVMFWVDDHGQTPAGKKTATVTLGGLTWTLWEESGYYAFVLDHNATSGTVDLLAGIKYLISRGDLSASDKLWQVNFGWEICSTAGVAQTFTMSNFTLASNYPSRRPSSGPGSPRGPRQDDGIFTGANPAPAGRGRSRRHRRGASAAPERGLRRRRARPSGGGGALR
jgi:hypothetical protein